MPDGYVVRLQVIIHRDFPIDVPDVHGDGTERHHFFATVGLEFLAELVPGLGHRLRESSLRIRREAHEDETKSDIGAHRTQPVLRAIEPRKTFPNRCADQAAVVTIGPTVIRAGDGCRAIPRTVEQARAAMTADIVERPDGAVAIA